MPIITDSVKIVEGAAPTGEMSSVSLGTGPHGNPMHAEVWVSYRDLLGSSVEAFSGAVVAPPSDTTLCTMTPGTAGIWEVQVSLAIAGDPGTDYGNCQIEQSGVAFATISPGLSPVFRKTLSALDTLQIDTINAASAGSVYAVTMSAKQIG